MRFAHLDAARAARLVGEAFPTLVDRRVGGPPPLPRGQRIVGYLSDTVAQVALGGRRHGVIESIQPMALETSPGHHSPVDLSLNKAGATFEPSRPAVGVSIPKRLNDGVQLPTLNLSLTPVDAHASPLGGSQGSVDGAGVLYANTQTDTDTFVKPTSGGFEAETLLRSVASPERLYFRVSLPEGAKLAPSVRGPGSVSVMLEGRPIALVPAPSARDAAGTPVPVAMTVKGDVLELNVAVNAGDYQWPIVVDPQVADTQVVGEREGEPHSAWLFRPSKEPTKARQERWRVSSSGEEGLSGGVSGSYEAGEGYDFLYETRGLSHIYAVHADQAASYDAYGRGWVEFAYANEGGFGQETPPLILAERSNREASPLTFCTSPGLVQNISECSPYVGHEPNLVKFGQRALGPAPGSPYYNELYLSLQRPSVYIEQKASPSISFSEGWLGPYTKPVEVKVHDPGIGVSDVLVSEIANNQEFPVLEAAPIREGKCAGVQCAQEYKYDVTYGYPWVNAPPVKVKAEDATGVPVYAEHPLKVDGFPPNRIELHGLPADGEVSASPHAITVEAMDKWYPESPGSGLANSGVASLSLSIDGGPATALPGSCSGKCAVSAPYTIKGEVLSEGVHRAVVTATDYANNEAAKEFTFDIRHVNPVSIGPGSVDPTTGQFTLSATDVSLSGVGGVSRTYQSRNPTAGAGGPLGPQWAISLGGGQGLTVLPNGSVVLIAAGGGKTTFTRTASGEYISPKGDGSLRVEAREAEAGKGISEYVLSDLIGGTSTTFTQPPGTQSTAPAAVNQFGQEGAQLKHPVSDAIDASGNVWVTDFEHEHGRLEKFSPAGTLIAAYGSEGTAGGQFVNPWGIAIDKSTGHVYVTDQGNSRIQELSSSGAFIKAFGWGVSDGKAQFETCTEASKCKPGIAGAGGGQVSTEAGVAVDPFGNVWVADYGNNRLEEFTTGGLFRAAFGFGVSDGEAKSETCHGTSCRAGLPGSGNGQFTQPLNIAFSHWNAYVTDSGNGRVQELNLAGAYIAQFGASQFATGGLPYGIAADPNTNNLYVSDYTGKRVVEFSSQGSLITKFGAAGANSGQFEGPTGIAVSSPGGIYVVDYASNRIEDWARPAWLPTIAKGPLSAGTTTYAYQAQELEAGRTVIEPIEALAPPPAGVTCEALVRGCRALTFNYAQTTTATESTWGDYKGNLTRVYFHAWDPAQGKMVEPVVAQYAYDAQGRLRAEWDPRIETSTACSGACPALKKTYGYDAQGHVTAMTPPGQQPWLFAYGTSEGDSTAGRLLSVTRPAASTELAQPGPSPNNTSVPKLSTSSPAVGQAVTVTNGTWTNNPLSFSYQWLSCGATDATGGCEPIPGAVNQSYTPLARDRGRRLGVAVTATNAAGSVTAVTDLSQPQPVWGTSELSVEPAPNPPAVGKSAVWTVAYNVPVESPSGPSATFAPYLLSAGEVAKWAQKDLPVEGVGVFPPDEPMGWPASDYRRATLRYWDEHGRVVNTAVPSGAISTTEYNETNEVERTLSADNRAAAIVRGNGSSEKSAAASLLLDTKSTYAKHGSELEDTRGPQHTVKLAEGGSEPLARNHVHYAYDEGAPPGQEPHLVTKTIDVAEYEGKEADKRTTTTSYSGVSWYPGQEGIGWTLRKPTSVTTDPEGLNLTTSTVYDPQTGSVLETITPAGGKSAGPHSYAAQFAGAGAGSGQLSNPRAVTLDGEGNLWVADAANNRIDEFSRTGTFMRAFGEGVSKGKRRLEVCTSECQTGRPDTKRGALNRPEGIAYHPPSELLPNGALYVSDTGNNRVQVFSLEGSRRIRVFGKPGAGVGQFNSPQGLTVDSQGNVWVADAGNSRLERFTERGKRPVAYGSAGTGEGQFNGISDVTFCAGKLYATDYGGQRVEEFTTWGAPAGQLGTEGGRLTQISRIACDPTNNALYVTDSGAGRVDVFASSGTFLAAFGSAGAGAGQLNGPTGVAVAASGVAYVLDAGNNRVSEWLPSSAAHDTQTIYYSTEAKTVYQGCGGHPEWANLPCQTQPAIQPPSGPSLPVSTLSYNVWDELERTSERFGSTTRTKTETYDPAGRGLTSEVTSSANAPLPRVTNAYNAQSGLLETQSATAGETTKTITSTYNTLGQLESYTDADGNTTKYTYEKERDARLKQVEDAKGKQTYGYDETTTGEMTTVLDAGLVNTTQISFKASYDVEGKLESEQYSNGLTASYTINPVGQATGVEYTKSSSCGESCTWYSDSVTPSIHGETLAEESTLAKETYAYDQAGRMTEALEEPAGKPCAKRIYGYDEESNRTGLTTVGPTGGKCAGEEGPSEHHSYDAANRLADPGISYDTLGNMRTLPASDAGGHEIKSEYYVDGQLSTQTQYSEKAQGNETLKYIYDPAGRERETIAEGKAKTTTISHYPGPGSAISWTGGGVPWSRNIPGIDGTLSAIQTASETKLQLHDLKGNIVATAGISQSETKLLSTYNSTEFGVPNGGKEPPKYAWLGAFGVSTELSSGVASKGGASYVPQIARDLQTAPVSVPVPRDNGAAAGYTAQISAWSIELMNAETAAVIAEYAAKQEAERKQREREAAEAATPPGEVSLPGEGGAEETVTGDPAGSIGVCKFDVEWSWTSDAPDVVTFIDRFKCGRYSRKTHAFEPAYYYFRGFNYVGSPLTSASEGILSENENGTYKGFFTQIVFIGLDKPFGEFGLCLELRRPKGRWSKLQCISEPIPKNFRGP